MDLLARVGIIVVIIIIVAAIGFLIFKYAIPPSHLTAQQAEQVVVKDLQLSHPNASVAVINVTNSTLAPGSWVVFVSLVYNATKPCPTVYLEEYDYPATGLVPTVANLYTSKCVIYGLVNSSLPFYTYLITNPEVAIAKSFNTSYPALVSYNRTFGYGNIFVHARYYTTLNATQTPLNRPFYNVWLINYTATDAQYSQFVVMNDTGAIAANFTRAK